MIEIQYKKNLINKKVFFYCDQKEIEGTTISNGHYQPTKEDSDHCNFLNHSETRFKSL